MRKLLVAAALAPAALLLTAAAPQDVLDQVEAKATELLGQKGLNPTGWVNNGSLEQGGKASVKVSLKGGAVYSIVGMCDNGCTDLNTVLTDASGNEVDSDVEADDFPLLVTDKSGTFTLTVTMVGCKTSTCRYRLKSYSK